jgi:hypothetical protein
VFTTLAGKQLTAMPIEIKESDKFLRQIGRTGDMDSSLLNRRHASEEKNMIRRINMMVGLVVLLAVSAFSQGKDSNDRPQNACVAEAKIEFVRYGKRPSIYINESDERVWLRFVNQSKKTLIFDAQDSQRTIDFLGRISKELDIYYEMVKKENCGSDDEIVRDRPVGYTRREAYYTVTLKPGQSFIFSVARQHLSKGHAIYLVYSFSKKGDRTDEDTGPKKVYFFDSQMP